MQRATINRRLLILLLWPDGHASHDGLHYADLPEALEVLKPHDHILVEVQDHSKQEITNA